MGVDTTLLESGSSPAAACAGGFVRLVGFGSGTTDVPPDLFLYRSGIPAWKYLIGRPLGLDERISLISDIFSDHDETREVRRLCGDDAQSFVDLVDEVFPCSFPFHGS